MIRKFFLNLGLGLVCGWLVGALIVHYTIRVILL